MGKKTKAGSTAVPSNARRRGPKPYPAVTFEEALTVSVGIMEHAAGEQVARLRLLELMGINPNARATRDAITNSGRYGLTQGGYQADKLQLTEGGRKVVDPATPTLERRRAVFNLAIEQVLPFKQIYDAYAGKSMPALEVMQDLLTDLDQGDRKPCVDIFVGNAKYAGLLRNIGGSQHLLTIDAAVEGEPQTGTADHAPTSGSGLREAGRDVGEFARTCFFIAPIGDPKSKSEQEREYRKHSDTVLNQYVRRAIDELNLKVVRADEISEPGMISKQIAEYVVKSALVVADLSYHNPNVFYELCLRHVTGKPTVHIVRKGDRIPFDIGNFRTITIEMEDLHEALANLDTLRAEIANFVRSAMESGGTKDNPILSYFPNASFSIGESRAK